MSIIAMSRFSCCISEVSNIAIRTIMVMACNYTFRIPYRLS